MRELRAGRFSLALRDEQPLIMGIVNVGSDSVADDLHLGSLADQVERAKTLIAEGAAIIDVGVQSGRTDTRELPVNEEIELLTPLVSELASEGAIVSVDTYRASVAAAAVEAGASIINDVGGLFDEEIADVAAESSAGLVLMHTRAAPKTVSFPGYEDPVIDVIEMLQRLMDISVNAGVSEEQLILDPGLDYAKTPEESIEVLRRLDEIDALERPVLLAVSRKYFLGMLTNRRPMERLASTLAAVSFGVNAGASILRVHDVAEVSDFLAVKSALSGQGRAKLLGDREAESLKWLEPKEAVRSHTTAALGTPFATMTSPAGGSPDTPLTTIAAITTTPAAGDQEEGQA